MGLSPTGSAGVSQAVVDAALLLKLDAQTAANSTARLALTGLSRGARVYQTDTGFWYELTNAAAPSDAASWAIQRPIQTAVLTADFPKDNDTLANVTDLTLTGLLAGHWYQVTGRVASSSPAVGWQLGFNGGTVTATGLSGGYLLRNNDNSLNEGANLSALTDLIVASSADPSFALFDFTIQVNAAGTLIMQFAQNTTNATPTPLLKYATIQAIDVT